MAELFFGDFRFDTRRLVLSGPEGPVEVRNKTLQALTYLIAHRNRFVTREEMMEQLWPDVRVTSASITQCISELRQALGDSAKDPKYIETRVKQGYRFSATLYHKPTEVLEPLPPPSEQSSSAPETRKRIPVRLWIMGGVVMLLVVGLGWFFRSSSPRGGPLSIDLSIHVIKPATDASRKMAGAVEGELRRLVKEQEGMVFSGGSGTGSGEVLVEVSIRATAAGGLELQAVLRSTKRNRQVWGWTWVVPEREAPSTAERVAMNIVRELATHRDEFAPAVRPFGRQ